MPGDASAAAAAATFPAADGPALTHLLKCVGLLRGLPAPQLAALVRRAERLDYAAGDRVLRRGRAEVPALYVVRTGAVWLRRKGEDPVKMPAGSYFGAELLAAAAAQGPASGNADAPLPAPYDVKADGAADVQLVRLTRAACRAVFDVDAAAKEDSMYARHRTGHAGPSEAGDGASVSSATAPQIDTVIHHLHRTALEDESGEDERCDHHRKAKHKKKKKKDHESHKKKKKKDSSKRRGDSDDSVTSSDVDLRPPRHGSPHRPKAVAQLEPEPKEAPGPAPEPEAASAPSFAEIRKTFQEKSKGKPNPLEFIASPARSPKVSPVTLARGYGVPGTAAVPDLDLSPAPKPKLARKEGRPVSPPKYRSSHISSSERKHYPGSLLDVPMRVPKGGHSKHRGDTKARSDTDESDGSASGKRQHGEDRKQKKQLSEKHILHKARQNFDNVKQTREEAKQAPKDKKPLRPPQNVFQWPLPLEMEYQAPTYPKSQDDAQTLTRALSNAFPFKDMQKNNMDQLIAAFEPTHVGAGTEFVTPEDEEDYFYVVNHGKVVVEELDGKEIREVGEGEALGDINLVHSTKSRKTSVRAKTDADLFRVDQTTYRKILQTELTKEEKEKRKLLDMIGLFQNVSDRNKRKLYGIMEPVNFRKGKTIVTKKDYARDFYIVKEGRVKCQDPSQSSESGRLVGTGGYFGETALVTGDFYPVDVTAATDATVYRVNREKFEQLLGPVKHVIVSPVEARTLCSLEVLRIEPYMDLNYDQSCKLVARIEDRTFAAGQNILEAGEETGGKLFFVRQGRAEVHKRVKELVVPGSVFGEDLFQESKTSKRHTGKSKYTVVAKDKCVCGVLRISDYRAVWKQYATSKARAATERARKQALKEASKNNVSAQFVLIAEEDEESSEEESEDEEGKRKVEFHNLVKKICLGEGNFGQVWMVYDKSEDPRRPYALKIQSKYQLVKEKQAAACIREKEAMAKLKHPNIVRLAASFQDTQFVYMLLPMIQGGELFNLMHPIDEENPDKPLPEDQAKFYAYVLADVLAYLHDQKYVYRDLKPENVLLDRDGYPVLIDFGFAKRLTGKTYTLCGTPGYLPPECCQSRGHTFSADHWSFGILVYEMLCGESPFYHYGIDQEDLYRSIIEDDYDPPMYASMEACDLIDRLLVKDPLVRLGSLSGGEGDILCHDWFKGLDSGMVRRRTLKAPWIPPLGQDPFDSSQFDDWSDVPDKTEQEYPELKPEDAALFKGF